jgi:hypothetical protein
MGLDTTHDCWHGAYSAFHSFRQALASLVGIQLDQMVGFGGQTSWPDKASEPLVILLDHSDAEDEIAVEDLRPLAKRLRELSGQYSDPWGKAIRRFATGLEQAANAGEPVEFH